ncbi:MAG: virulence factor family protein [Rhodobacteraceae bacterium]|nr:virulence factor family protein [Paracoccaceae bacterium]
MRRHLAIALAGFLATSAAWGAEQPWPTDLDPGLIPAPQLYLPGGPAAGMVFLFSGAAGWGANEDGVATRLQHAGAAVVGIDLPSYFSAIDSGGSDCVYLVADFERLSHELERQSGAETFHAPLLGGIAEGGALAMDILGQTPADTLGGVVAANPAAGQALARSLCMKFTRETASDGGSFYDLPPGAQPAPLTVVLGSDAPTDSVQRVDAAAASGVTLTRKAATGTGYAALSDTLASIIAADNVSGDAPAIVELPAQPSRDTMAIMVSGDGGWRDIDRTVAGMLQADGVPVVGLDSLRWFWAPRTPEETGRELGRLIDIYTDRWNTDHVILAGYSFGASILPAAFLSIPAEAQAKVSEIALLGPGTNADWQITVSGWLGSTSSQARPVAPDLSALPADRVLCIYGEKDLQSACPTLEGSGAKVIKTGGGHHFDGDYPALARHVLDGS